MTYELTAYAVALWASALVSSLTAIAAWLRRLRSPGGRSFVLMMVCVVIWNAMSALEAGTAELSAKLILSKIGYIGIAGVAPFLLRFSLEYGGKQRRFGLLGNVLLWTIPAVTVGLVFTNEWHHLVWTSLVPRVTPRGAVLLYGHGAWYWIWVAYFGVVSLFALILLVQAAFQYRKIYIWQSAVFLAGVGLPWIGEILYLTRITSFPGLDLPTIGFAAMGVLVLFGMSRFALFDLVPVARTILVERMSEGVIVLDSTDRVVDMNPAAQALLGIETDAVGRPGREMFPLLLDLYAATSRGDGELRTSVHLDRTPPLVVDLVITALRDRRGTLTGRLFVIRDVTVREKLVIELRAALADVKTLRGLLPICASCKKIRDNKGYWHNVEDYIQSHSEARFSHGLCDECLSRLYSDFPDGDDPGES
jgi:PAS domain-containing protein